jgi:anaerobic dimethyl sulfoxide reductase subunit C (anchor subunit)
MNVEELPMILITVIAQLCVGMFLVLGAIDLTASVRHRPETVERITAPALFVIVPGMALGFAVSAFHMHDVTHVLNVFRNLGSSWLSREVAFGCAFAALGFVFAVMAWLDLGSRRARRAAALLTAALGLGLLWSMSEIYASIPTIPAWHTPFVPFEFFTTAILLGALAVSFALMAANVARARRSPRPAGGTARAAAPAQTPRAGAAVAGAVAVTVAVAEPVAAPAAKGTGGGAGRGAAWGAGWRARRDEINAPATDTEWALATRTVQGLAIVAALAGLAELIAYPLHISALSGGGGAAHAAALALAGPVLWTRLTLLAVAVVVAATFIVKTAAAAVKERPGLLQALISVALVCAAVSALIGRALHYETMTHVGI